MTENSKYSVVLTTRAVLLAGLLFCPSAFSADPGFDKDDAAKQAQKQNGGGRVLGVKEVKKDGSTLYMVKLITDGKVRVFTIKAP